MLLAVTLETDIDAAAVAAVMTFVVLVAGYVLRSAWRFNRWLTKEQARNAAVDTFMDDWRQRGISVEGAVQEQHDMRDTVVGHTAAIADNRRRIDNLETSIDTRLSHIEAATGWEEPT